MFIGWNAVIPCDFPFLDVQSIYLPFDRLPDISKKPYVLVYSDDIFVVLYHRQVFYSCAIILRGILIKDILLVENIMYVDGVLLVSLWLPSKVPRLERRKQRFI